MRCKTFQRRFGALTPGAPGNPAAWIKTTARHKLIVVSVVKRSGVGLNSRSVQLRDVRTRMPWTVRLAG
jgi:hypothetical protein